MLAEKHPGGPGTGTSLPIRKDKDMNISPLYRRTAQIAAHLQPQISRSQIIGATRAMSGTGTGTSTPMTGASTPIAQEENGERKLKILMLHGMCYLMIHSLYSRSPFILFDCYNRAMLTRSIL